MTPGIGGTAITIPRARQYFASVAGHISKWMRSIRGAQKQERDQSVDHDHQPKDADGLAGFIYAGPENSRRTPRFSTSRTSAMPSLTKTNAARWKIASSIFWAPGGR